MTSSSSSTTPSRLPNNGKDSPEKGGRLLSNKTSHDAIVASNGVKPEDRMNRSSSNNNIVSSISNNSTSNSSSKGEIKKKRASTYIGPRVGQELICGCCWDIITQATTLVPCGHTYCNECVFHPENHDKRCPTCRAVIVNTVPNRTIDNIIAALISAYDKSIDSTDNDEDDNGNDVVVRCFPVVDVQTYRKRLACCSSEPMTFQESKRRAEQQLNERQHQRRRLLVSNTSQRTTAAAVTTATNYHHHLDSSMNGSNIHRRNSNNSIRDTPGTGVSRTSYAPTARVVVPSTTSTSTPTNTTGTNTNTSTTTTATASNSQSISLSDLLLLSYTMPTISAYDVAAVENTLAAAAAAAAASSEYNRHVHRTQLSSNPTTATATPMNRTLSTNSTHQDAMFSSSPLIAPYTTTNNNNNNNNRHHDTSSSSSLNDINFVELLHQSLEQQQHQFQQQQQSQQHRPGNQDHRHHQHQQQHHQNEHSWIDLLLNDGRLFATTTDNNATTSTNNININLPTSSPLPFRATSTSNANNNTIQHRQTRNNNGGGTSITSSNNTHGTPATSTSFVRNQSIETVSPTPIGTNAIVGGALESSNNNNMNNNGNSHNPYELMNFSMSNYWPQMM